MKKEQLEIIRKNEDRTLMMVVNEVSKTFREKISRLEETLLIKANTEREILAILSYKNGLTQNDLARATNTKGSTVSIAISKLESMELIKRTASTQDKRCVRVYLTEKGYDQNKKVKQILDREDKNIMRGISLKDAKYALDILEIMLDNMVEDEK